MNKRKVRELEREWGGLYRRGWKKRRDKLCNYVNLIKEIICKTYRREYSVEFS